MPPSTALRRVLGGEPFLAAAASALFGARRTSALLKVAGSLPTRTVGEARGVPLGDAMLLNAALHRSGFGRLALKSGPAGVESRLESRIDS